MTSAAGRQRLRVVAVRGRSWISGAMPAVEAEELQRAIAESLRLIGDGAGTFLLPTDVGTALIRGREVLAVEAVDVPVSHPRPGASAAPSPLSLAGRRPAAAGR